MPDLRELQQKLDSIRALEEIVQAMRNLAAMYVRRAESTLDAIRPYTDVTAAALDVALGQLPAADPAQGGGEGEARTVALVFTGDQGLCGTYNDRIVREALRFMKESAGPVDTIAIGHRGSSLLRMKGVEPILDLPAPTSVEGIRSSILSLTAEVFETYAQSGARRLVFLFNAYDGMGRFTETRRSVLPPARTAHVSEPVYEFRSEPLLTAPAEELLGAFVEEYFFVELYRALLESHASENGARLMAMTAAAVNIEKRLGELTQSYQMARQDSITSELLDVVGGAEAMAGRSAD